MDGVIIAILLITNALTLAVLGGVYWRKRVWKRRALQSEPSFWSLVRQNIADSQQRFEQDRLGDTVEWPNVLDK